MATGRLLSAAAAPVRALLKARAPVTPSPQHPLPTSRHHTAAQRSQCYSDSSSSSSSSPGAGTPGKGLSRSARKDAETTRGGGRRKSPQRGSSGGGSSSSRTKRPSSGATRSSRSGGKKKPLSVYLLRSAAPGCNSTYCGTTRTLGSRLQQHNGLRKGGAKATLMNRPWEFLCVIDGFPDDTAALQCEWRLKHWDGTRKPPRRAAFTGPSGRVAVLNYVLCSADAWTAKALPLREYPGALRVRVHADYPDALDEAAIAEKQGPGAVVVMPLG